MDGSVATSIAFSPDGQIIASAYWVENHGYDAYAYVLLHRVSDGLLLRRLEFPLSRGVGSLAFSRDASLLAAGAGRWGGDTVKIWRVADGAQVLGFSDYLNYAKSVMFTPDGGQLIVAGRDARTGMARTISFYAVPGGARVRWFGDWEEMSHAVQTPDGAVIIVAPLNGDLIRFYRASDGELLGEVVSTGRDLRFAVSPDGSAVAAGAYYGDYIEVWRVADRSLLLSIPVLTQWHHIYDPSFSPDGTVLVTAGTDRVDFWRVSDGSLLRYYTPGAWRVSFSPDGAFFAYAGGGHALTLARNPYAPFASSELTVPNVTGRIGETVNLAARLTSSGAGVQGKTVAFSLAGSPVGEAITDSSGWALLPYTIPHGPGSGVRNIEASFAGDASFAPSSAEGWLSVFRTHTSAYAIDRSGRAGDLCYLRGYLYRQTDRGWIGGRSLAFSVDGSQVGTAVTDIEGRAVLPYMVPEDTAPGPRPIGVSWAGDADYYPSSTSSTLTVTEGSLYIWALQPRMASVGGSVYLRAYVRSWPGLNWKPGLPIVFSVEGTQVGADTTNADGRASVLYTVPAEMAPGDHPFTCDFPGNAMYDPASGGGLLTVTP